MNASISAHPQHPNRSRRRPLHTHKGPHPVGVRSFACSLVGWVMAVGRVQETSETLALFGGEFGHTRHDLIGVGVDLFGHGGLNGGGGCGFALSRVGVRGRIGWGVGVPFGSGWWRGQGGFSFRGVRCWGQGWGRAANGVRACGRPLPKSRQTARFGVSARGRWVVATGSV